MTSQLSISRRQTPEGTRMSLSIKDEGARTSICELLLTPEQLMLALTGQFLSDVETRLGPTDKMGKVREQKTFEFPLPEGTTVYASDRKDIALKTGKSLAPEGWALDPYFGSQTSFFSKEDKPWARTSILRWL